MNPTSLKSRVQERLWEVVHGDDGILSATLTGSFLHEAKLEGISDIDLVLVVERLDAARYGRLVSAFDAALRDELAKLGYALRINPTLGPLKFNEPATAVLHLMLYSREAHVEHAIKSPFTCFDWQQSKAYCKRSLADVFPVFNLQPHQFISSRRSVRDYLRDFRAGVVSYRELECRDDGYDEVTRSKPMTVRDRHEFAYHILRFLMQNLVKLVRRANLPLRGKPLLAEYFSIFPESEEEIRRIFNELQTRKRQADFSRPIDCLANELQAFIDTFERQFRRLFFSEASRHTVFRHGPTAPNLAGRDEAIFLGTSEPDLLPVDPSAVAALAAGVAANEPRRTFSSPRGRCRQSIAMMRRRVSLPAVQCDPRLREIEYGQLEGTSVRTARASHAALFDAWNKGEDPRFPGGECSRDVLSRVLDFADQHWTADSNNSVTCTHNVVLRCLVGHVLRLPPNDWHRLHVPHLAPVTMISTKRHGLFVDIPTPTARAMFGDFAALAKAA